MSDYPSLFHPHSLTQQNKGSLTLTLFSQADAAIEQIYIRC